MARDDDDGEAPTIAASNATLADRSSRVPIGDLRPGTVIGRYRLVDRLGAGAMGVVWSAQDPQLDRRVAIKLVHPSLARSTDASGRLLREARAMAKLSSRAVVTVHDAGDVDGQLFLAMELVEGTTLGALLRERADAADWQRWLAMLLEAGRGLADAHRAGVLHRDFKPDNVLVDRAGRVCVGDFGLATLGEAKHAAAASLQWNAETALDLTTTGALLGTPAYMSPQQLRGEDIDARADQFGFCVALYEALYGRRPFVVLPQGLDMLPALVDAIEARVLPPPPLASGVPPAVFEVLRRGLAPEPGERWPDMATLLDELERAANLGRRSEGAVTAAIPRVPHGRAVYVAAGLAIVAITLAVVYVARRPTEPSAAITLSATRLFDIPSRARLALSPDGKRVAFASDGLRVRNLDGTQSPWMLPIGADDEILHIELGQSELWFMTIHSGIVHWPYETTGQTETVASVGGRWFGRMQIGDVAQLPDTTMIVRDRASGREVRRWPVGVIVEVGVISPDGRRFAYIEAGRFTGHIVVRTIDGDTVVRSEELKSPTAVAWIDDATLAYATGTYEHPKLFARPISAGGLGEPRLLYTVDRGWFGQIVARGGTLLFSDMGPSSRVKIIDRSKTNSAPVDLDRTAAASILGWTAAGELVTWSRSTQLVDVRGDLGMRQTGVTLDGEPANATFDGDLMIAALRREAGRAVVAVELSTGTVRWHHDAGTLAVRCAGDRHPPCYAIRDDATGDHVVAIDPKTGVMDSHELAAGKIEDLAVREDGTRILLASPTTQVTEIDATGAVVRTLNSSLSTVRSVAYDPKGDILLAGTQLRYTYRLGTVVHDRFTPLAESVDDVLSLVRPSPDGERVSLLARGFQPVVWQLAR